MRDSTSLPFPGSLDGRTILGGVFKAIRRWLKRGLFSVLVLAIIFATLLVYLGVTSPEPRASETWQRLADFPRPRGEVAAAVGARLTDDEAPLGSPGDSSLDQFIIVGGLSGLGNTVDQVDVFDPGTLEWTEGPPLPEPRHHMGAVGVGGVVFASGGAKTATDWTPQRNFWQLLPINDTWDELRPMPDARMGHQMVTIERKIYVVGGRGNTSNVLIFDTTDGTWATGAEMPAPRDHLGVAASGLRIYAIGGRDDALTDRVDIYDTITDRWIEGPPLPEPMSAMAVGALADGIHVVGGEDPATFGGNIIDKHYVLPPGGSAWMEAPLPILPVHGAAYGVVRGSLLITGGARRQGALSPIAWTGLTQVYTPGA